MKTKVTRTVALGIYESLLHAFLVTDRVWRRVTERHPIVTGLGEEGHSEGSRHYGVLFETNAGKVFSDVRAWAGDIRDDLTDEQRATIDAELRRRLGEGEYDLVWEKKKDGTPSHLHIEVDPKAVLP